MNVLVTGATGYIGGRLLPRLLERGHGVRVLVRDPDRIAGRSWATRVERHTGDLLDPGSLSGAFDAVDAAYYLVHGMTAGGDFAARDRRAAANFAGAARGVGLVVYLGGLLPEGDTSSEHLRSRAEVGALLRKALPTTEFRAGPIIGSGSASFEMVRYLTERLPVMVAPRWILNPVQPIGIDDVLAYLVEALEHPPLGVVEIGADRLSFRRMMLEYAAARGLRRKIFPVPVLAPGLAALWIGLVTPISNRLAVPLVEGIVEPVTADTGKAEAEFPDLRPIGYREAVERALEDSTEGEVETRWSGALGGVPSYELRDREGLMREIRARDVTADPETVFRTVAALGGDRGWPVSVAWKARGVLDQLVGGPGLRRGRRDPRQLLPGETLDFWRVERVEPPHLLRLRAEMKVPGRAWLQWETEATGERETRLRQTALFAPRGLPGLLYWYALYPIHAYVFSRMVDRVVVEAERAGAPAPERAADAVTGYVHPGGVAGPRGPRAPFSTTTSGQPLLNSEASASMRLVLLAHGSRDPVWRAPFERLARELTTTLGPASVRLAYLEFESPTLEEVLREAAREGVPRVRILPLFTSSGKHVREDLPEQVARARREAPSTAFELLPTLGEDPRFFELMRDLAREAADAPPEGP